MLSGSVQQAAAVGPVAACGWMHCISVRVITRAATRGWGR